MNFPVIQFRIFFNVCKMKDFIRLCSIGTAQGRQNPSNLTVVVKDGTRGSLSAVVPVVNLVRNAQRLAEDIICTEFAEFTEFDHA